MASKNVIIIVMILLTGLTSVWAQTSDYLELRYIQRLKWVGDEYTMRYEVIIQGEERGQYRALLNEFTEASFIEVSLHPGKYRVQVIPYDYLGKPIPVTEWMNFEVLPGSAPETETVVEYVTVTETITETETAAVTEYMRQFDLYAGAALSPLLPIHGENNLFGENVSPFGMSARLCIVSAKQGFLNPGIELAASWRVYGIDAEQAVNSAVFDFCVLAQSRFPGGRAALNFRAGAGLSLLPQNQSVSPNGQYSVHANIGASFLWLFLKNLYLEGGVDYAQFFTADNFGFFRPWIGLGYRF